MWKLDNIDKITFTVCIDCTFDTLDRPLHCDAEPDVNICLLFINVYGVCIYTLFGLTIYILYTVRGEDNIPILK